MRLGVLGLEARGTEGISRTVGEALQRDGLDVDIPPPESAAKAASFDVVVGSALYANRWHQGRASVPYG